MLDELALFVSIVETGSLRAAAEKSLDSSFYVDAPFTEVRAAFRAAACCTAAPGA